MPYSVRSDRIACDIDDEVRKNVLTFLKTYNFPYVTTVNNKKALQKLFIDHFENKTTLESLKNQIYSIASSKNLQGVAAVAWSETNRLHTMGLGNLLLSKGETECTTVHSYGMGPMSPLCKNYLDRKTLSIKEIISNSFPNTRDGLKRTDIAMIPQHINCRHVMAPIEKNKQ